MTLTEVTYYSRKFAPIGIIALLVVLIAVFGVRLLLLYLEIQSTTPTPTQQAAQPVPTDPIFGPLTPLQIPNAKSSSQYTYVLDTLDGTTNFTDATSAATVYFIPQKTASFGFLSKIYTMAKAVGIDTDIIEHTLEDKSASFDDGKRKITIDIRAFNFKYDYKITDDDNLDSATQAELESTLTSQATSFLSAVDRYPTPLSQGNRNILYMRLDPASKQVTTLDTYDGANMAEVDFYPEDINGFPVVTSSYYNSPNYVLFLLSGGEFKPVRSQIAYFETSQDQVGMYPLRTSDEAWTALQSGLGSIVSSSTDSGEVRIQKVFLAYYVPEVYQEYLQPVYVFLGENRFVGYVPAVSPELLTQ